MQLISSHTLLVHASTYENSCDQVQDFFKKTLLVRYDKIEIKPEKCRSATEEDFQRELDAGIRTNKEALNKLIEEFGKTGFQGLSDLGNVEMGYPSKMLHIITHFLDGFIGVDTSFYNFIEDSHWISQETKNAIQADRNSYWLIHLDCYSKSPENVGIIQH